MDQHQQLLDDLNGVNQLPTIISNVFVPSDYDNDNNNNAYQPMISSDSDINNNDANTNRNATTGTTGTTGTTVTANRTGSITSAQFNILSTMVGGGCLSLPLAFQKSGNCFIGPLLLVLTGCITEYIFRIIVQSSRIINEHNEEQQQHAKNNTTNNNTDTNNTNPIEQQEMEEQPLLNSTTATGTEDLLQQQHRIIDDNDNDNSNNEHNRKVGTDTFEGIAQAAFGTYMKTFCTILVFFLCFFGATAYAVLLRDMLLPINNYIIQQLFNTSTSTSNSDSDSSNNTNNTTSFLLTNNMNPFIFYSNQFDSTYSEIENISTTTQSTTLTSFFQYNLSMWIIIIFVAPACAIENFTSLQQFGMFGMLFVLILGCIIIYRSIQCVVFDTPTQYFWDAIHIQYLPNNWIDILDVIPLYISVYACHYNILPVHNELYNPTKQRVVVWLSSTVWIGTIFYTFVGFAGSVYGTCSSLQHQRDNENNSTTNNSTSQWITTSSNDTQTTTTTVSGNILLDFPSDDPLLFIGRMCLAVTITLAFPILIIPARDIVLRSIVQNLKPESQEQQQQRSPPRSTTIVQQQQHQRYRNEPNSILTQALLEDYDQSYNNAGTIFDEQHQIQQPHSDTASTVNESNSGTTSTEESNWLLINDIEGVESNTNNNNNRSSTNANDDTSAATTTTTTKTSFMTRLVAATCVLFIATALASCVSSIAIVWDLLGSSLSILLSYIIPASSYLMIVYKYRKSSSGTSSSSPTSTIDNDNISTLLVDSSSSDSSRTSSTTKTVTEIIRHYLSIVVAIVLLIIYIPLMFLSTENAIYNIFILHKI